MSRAYSLGLRQRIVDAISEGKSRRAAGCFQGFARHGGAAQAAVGSNGLGRAVAARTAQRRRQIGPLPGRHHHQGGGATGYNHARPGDVAGRSS